MSENNRRVAPIEDRFWPRVTKTEGCWIWTGYKQRGYGFISIGRGKSPMLVHRLSYKVVYGELDKGLAVCHHCDNPSCVRPDHLFLGTLADNNADMLRKGRASGGSSPGEMSATAKLTADQVRHMRAIKRPGLTYREIAKMYNITKGHAQDIITRKAWKHIP